MNSDEHPRKTLSAGALVKATIAASALAVMVLVTVILPAEYNVDPSGLGEKLGLMVFSEPSVAVAPSVKQPNSIDEAPPQVINVTVPSGEGIEYKFRMNQFSKMTYVWRTDGQPIYHDLHGEPADDTTGYFESYVVATANQLKGSFTAPFDGSHGWYWKNDTDNDIEIHLTVEGQFDVIGLK